MPSMTGEIIDISLKTTSNTSSLIPFTQDDLEGLESFVAGVYNVDKSEVQIDAYYSSEGTIELTPGTEISDEILTTLKESLAEVLGIPTHAVDVIYDDLSGDLTYTIVSTNATEIIEITDDLLSVDIVDVINDNIEEEIEVIAVNAEDEIISVIDVEVDGDEVDYELINQYIEEHLGDQFDVDISGIYLIIVSIYGQISKKFMI